MTSGQIWKFLHQLRGRFGPEGAAAPSEGELLERFVRQRDDDAFAELMARHGPMVFGVCRRLLPHTEDAEDAFQATFLVLARRANAIRSQESVASWLYGTSYRVALKARESINRRRARENPPDPSGDQVSPPLTELPAVPSAELSPVERQELRAVLDEELQRLPEKYRAPLVLCYLEGKTNEEAAQELAWTKGTVSGQLARARDLLRQRLMRRGLALTTAAVAGVLSEQLSAAAVPACLSGLTSRAAASFAAGETVALVPPHVVLLAEGALQTMTMTKWKVAAALLVAVSIVGIGTGVLGYQLRGPRTADGDSGPAKDSERVTVPVPLPPKLVKAEGKSDPPGVPLAVKLVAKKDTYLLDLDGKTPNEYRKQLESGEGPWPPMPVDLVLRFTNTGDENVSFWVGGDAPDLPYFLKLDGPGAVNRVLPSYKVGRPPSPPTKVDLAPGKSHDFPIQSLITPSVFRPGSASFWTAPGEYTLTATYWTVLSPAPKDAPKNEVPQLSVLASNMAGLGAVMLTSAPLKLNVVAAKQQGKAEENRNDQLKTDPPGIPLKLKLVAKKETYTLDLSGKTPEDFRKALDAQGSDRPAPPQVDLVAELTNTGNAEMRLALPGGDRASFSFTLEGPGAVNGTVYRILIGTRRPYPMRQMKTLAAGEKVELPITALGESAYLPAPGEHRWDQGGPLKASYWLKPGQHTLRVQLHTEMAPKPKGSQGTGYADGLGMVIIPSNPITLKVVEPAK